MDSTLRAMASKPGAAPVERHDPPAGVPLFSTDGGPGTDALGHAQSANLMAELSLHRRTETPLCIGLTGPSGAGKSLFLDQTLGAIARLAAAAAEAGLATSFEADMLVARLDAGVAGDPDLLLWGAVFDQLAETHPALAADLAHAGADPHLAVRAASEALGAARRTLDAERQALEALGARDARLVETVIEAPGSAVDVYARAKRPRIEALLRRFGFSTVDPIGTFKDLVRESAEETGGAARAGMAFRALYAFTGQTRLIVGAVLLILAAWGLSAVRADQDSWIETIRGSSEKAGPVADWLQGHLPWLGPLQSTLLLLAVVLLFLNVVRAARFVLPLARGVDLLQEDVEARRRDLQSLIAHQTKRVDTLTAEADAASQHAAEVERRAGGRPGARSGPARPAALAARTSGAAAFFAALSAAMLDPAVAAPRRLVVAVDGLEQRPAEAAAAVLAAVRRLLGPGAVGLVVVDRAQAMSGFGEADPAASLDRFLRCVQVPFRVDALEPPVAARRDFALALIDGRPPALAADAVVDPDPRQSVLERPFAPREVETVAALAPFAGETPRAIKRFVNIYRIARADPRFIDARPATGAALGIALALDAYGFADELAAFGLIAEGKAPDGAGTLGAMLAAAKAACGETIEAADARLGLAVAARFSSRL